MRHKLCRSFHPWCPGVKNRCLYPQCLNYWGNFMNVLSYVFMYSCQQTCASRNAAKVFKVFTKMWSTRRSYVPCFCSVTYIDNRLSLYGPVDVWEGCGGHQQGSRRHVHRRRRGNFLWRSLPERHDVTRHPDHLCWGKQIKVKYFIHSRLILIYKPFINRRSQPCQIARSCWQGSLSQV